MKLNLINLDRDVGRLQRFVAVNNHQGEEIVRFPAVDGGAVDISQLIERGIIRSGVLETYTAGRLGGALSHLALWDKAIATGETQTVCEDDAILHPDFGVCSAQLVGRLSRDWDIILWGWNFNAALDFELLPGVTPCLVLFEQAGARGAVANFQRLAVAPQTFRLRQALGLPCYSVSPKGAQALREFCLPIRPMQLRLPGGRRLRNIGIDCMMAGLYPEIRAFVSFPPLAITKNEPASAEAPILHS